MMLKMHSPFNSCLSNDCVWGKCVLGQCVRHVMAVCCNTDCDYYAKIASQPSAVSWGLVQTQ